MSGVRLIRLHVIAKQTEQAGKLRHLGKGEFESGHWRITPDVAEKAVGAELHLHEYQDKQSWFAGVISAWHLSDLSDRVVFHLKKEPSLYRAQRKGWGNEQARVWATESRMQTKRNLNLTYGTRRMVQAMLVSGF